MFSYYQDPKKEHFEEEFQQGEDVLLNGACAPLNNPFLQDNRVSPVREDNRNTDNSYITNLTEHSTSLPGSSSKLTMNEVITSSGKQMADSTCTSTSLVSTLIQSKRDSPFYGKSNTCSKDKWWAIYHGKLKHKEAGKSFHSIQFTAN